MSNRLSYFFLIAGLQINVNVLCVVLTHSLYDALADCNILNKIQLQNAEKSSFWVSGIVRSASVGYQALDMRPVSTNYLIIDSLPQSKPGLHVPIGMLEYGHWTVHVTSKAS